MPDPAPATRRLIHKGAKFDFEELQWNAAGGKVIRRQIVRHPGAVAVLPILPDGRLVFIENFRHAAESRLLEIPAGTLEPPEDPEACARRELLEETGYRAATMRSLGRFYTSPGMSNELMHAFLATDLREEAQALEEDEDLRVRLLTPAEAGGLLDRGELLDGKTMLVLLLAQRRGLWESRPS
jgi:ADP-ribose pyrophosphatase